MDAGDGRQLDTAVAPHKANQTGYLRVTVLNLRDPAMLPYPARLSAVMLVFAAIILGAVCAHERRATGGVLAPILTHMVWGLIMVLALPPVFGL